MRKSNINTTREKMQLLTFSSQINSFDVTLMGTFSSTKPTFKQVLRHVKHHWETGGPNISMVSRTRERWSRNELTDTRRIRASSARHLLNTQSSSVAKVTGVFIVRGGTKMGSLHRKGAARQCQLLFDATFPRLPVWWQRTQGDDSLTGGWEGNVQRAVKRVKDKSSISKQ